MKSEVIDDWRKNVDKATIKVIAVGKAGGKIINKMLSRRREGIQYVVVKSDAEDFVDFCCKVVVDKEKIWTRLFLFDNLAPNFGL